MQMNRRQLLTALSAVFAAPVATALAEVLPLPPASRRHWGGEGLRFTGFKASVTGDTVMCGQILGQRSDDGELFYVAVVVQLEDYYRDGKQNVPYLRDRLTLGMAKMDTFLDERCTCSARIIGYREWVDDEGLYGEPGETRRSPIHPPCEVHP